MVKKPPANAGGIRDMGLIPGLGRSPGEVHGNPLQYSCLEIPRTEEPGGLQSIGLQRVKEMATHSSILAWKIPWTEIVLNINISNYNKTF